MYASDNLKNDLGIVYEAIELSRERVMGLAPTNILSNREVVLAALRDLFIPKCSCPGPRFPFHCLPLELLDDKEVILECVRHNGRLLGLASESLQNDRDVVAATCENGLALQYASKALRSDRDIVLHAVKSNGMALRYAPQLFRSDREIVFHSIKCNGYHIIGYASADLQNDPWIQGNINN